MKVGDFVQYRTAFGVVLGYALILRKDGLWFVLRDHETGKEEFWPENLMKKVVL